jgi:glycosyltransferase involved in cell wall biosynthesis
MADLVLDMTPTCINRTAIYHIAMDTYQALSQEFQLAAQFRGAQGPLPTQAQEREAIRDAFFKDVGAFAGLSPHADELDLAPQMARTQEPILFFDPIYALYQPLRAKDVVLVLDLSTLTNPEWHSPGVVRCYERAFRKIACSPAKVATISEHCTAVMRANFAVRESEIVTVPLYLRDLPAKVAATPSPALKPKQYFLFVGSMERRKNIVGLIRAFEMSGLADEGWRLALAGGDGLGAEEIKAAAEEARGVDLLGFVSDGELAWLYENAAAFAYPSYLEGFGLPLLEAMMRGLPCMASITGASQEVCGDLGVLVDPYNAMSIVQGLRECEKRARNWSDADSLRLKQRAAHFSFENYLRVLKSALSA